MYILPALSDYVKDDDKWCAPDEGKADEPGESYNNLLDAQNACNQKKDCKVFYDVKSEGNLFVLCGSPYRTTRSDFLKSRMYKKCKIDI